MVVEVVVGAGIGMGTVCWWESAGGGRESGGRGTKGLGLDSSEEISEKASVTGRTSRGGSSSQLSKEVGRRSVVLTVGWTKS